MKRAPMIKPENLSDNEWETRLRSERADVMRQIRQMVHTSRSTGSLYTYCDRIDRALSSLKADSLARSENISRIAESLKRPYATVVVKSSKGGSRLYRKCGFETF